MRYEAHFTFYLPFRLPSSSWERRIVSLILGEGDLSSTVVVLPRSCADEYVAPVQPPEMQSHTRTPLIQPQDFLEAIAVVVYGEKREVHEIFEPANITVIQRKALHVANRFLNWCRVLDHQVTTVKTIPHIDVVDDSGFCLLYWPWDVCFFERGKDEPLNQEFSKKHGQFVGFSYRPKSKDLSWQKVEERLSRTPDPVELIYLDAIEAWHWGNYRRFVLDAGTALEIAVDRKLAVVKDPATLRKLKQKYRSSKFAARNFEILPKSLGLPSLKDANEKLFDSVNRLYEIRNKVIHEGLEEFDPNEMETLKSDLRAVLDWCGTFR